MTELLDNNSQPHISELDNDSPETKESDLALIQSKIGEAATGSVIDRPLPLLEDIPPLLPMLQRIQSPHEHLKNPSGTVHEVARTIRQIPDAERTPDQQDVLDDIDKIADYIIGSPDKIQMVYKPDELHGLVTKLERLKSKNRPDFHGVEGQIIDVMLAIYSRNKMDIDESLRGIVKRAEADKDNRKGMTWKNLTSMAGVASQNICFRNQMDRNEETYFISVQDPESEGPDLTTVYQFIADRHALDVIGYRQTEASKTNAQTFVSNCDVVNEWFSQIEPFLASIPASFKCNGSGAAYSVREMVEAMNQRLTSKATFGTAKGYKYDTIAAIKLQLKIGHTAEAIREFLDSGGVDESEIVPLEA